MNSKQESLDRCFGCGLAVAGGTAGCQSIMDELLALHFSNASYFGVHRLFVDVYCLQHPDRYCVSFKSLAAHLAHLCWSLEHGGSRAIPSEAIRKWVERNPHLEKPALPTVRGAMTIGDVARASNSAEHHRAVAEWARSTWDAYAELQSTARCWVKASFERRGPADTGEESAATARKRVASLPERGRIAQKHKPRGRHRQ